MGDGEVKRLFSKRVQELDLATQKILYDQFFHMVYRIVFKYVEDESAVSEVVQETFIRAFKYISAYREQESGSFERWLGMIAKNQAIKYVNQRWKRNEIPSEEMNIDIEHSYDLNERSPFENQVIEKLTIEEIKEMLIILQPEERLVILLRFDHEQSYQEIADTMGIQDNTVRQRYHRAIKKLKALLLKKWGTADE